MYSPRPVASADVAGQMGEHAVGRVYGQPLLFLQWQPRQRMQRSPVVHRRAERVRVFQTLVNNLVAYAAVRVPGEDDRPAFGPFPPDP